MKRHLEILAKKYNLDSVKIKEEVIVTFNGDLDHIEKFKKELEQEEINMNKSIREQNQKFKVRFVTSVNSEFIEIEKENKDVGRDDEPRRIDTTV